MRTAHFAAFEEATKANVPALANLVYDGEAPLVDGEVKRETYVVLHDMGFDGQDDARLAAQVADAADGTYRVIARLVAIGRAGARAAADAVKSGMVGVTLTVEGRRCSAIELDPGPRPVERDDDVSPPLFYIDLDFTFRSTRA